MLWSFEYNNDYNAKSDGMDFFVVVCVLQFVLRVEHILPLHMNLQYLAGKKHCVHTAVLCAHRHRLYPSVKRKCLQQEKLLYHLCFGVMYYYFIWLMQLCALLSTPAPPLEYTDYIHWMWVNQMEKVLRVRYQHWSAPMSSNDGFFFFVWNIYCASFQPETNWNPPFPYNMANSTQRTARNTQQNERKEKKLILR